VAFGEAGYPESLAAIYQPPLVLYVRGSLPSDAEGLGIVGARRFSRYGEGIAEKLGEELAASGFCVVSGAARGIDSAAHRGALRTGCTVAVLGCGVDIAYPAENRRLLADIVASGGAILSEYAPGTPPLPAFFPARNRIISGLSKGVIVVEAAERSGSLITAQLALDEGRDVFAVPGSIYSPTSQGCHRLIQQGAKLVTSVRDVLEEYGREPMPRAPRKRKDADLSGEERALYQVLSYEHPLSIDEIIASLKDGDPARLSFLLLGLELKGLVIENESHGYLRAERE
ncbi:MAG: DNA-processing protein DprA, partial [Selenomonas sp.]|nr:DNA-processing protein DprA [Selenomonas sp.]